MSHAHAPIGEAPTPPPAPPTSELLIRIVENCPEGNVSIGDLIDGLGDRAFGVILLILALPVAIPGPPGLPVVFGTPMLIFAAQLWLGHAHPWLPRFVRRRTFPRLSLLSLLRRCRPVLAWMEKICRPRILAITTPTGERWLGAFIALSAAVLINPVPIPFSHLPIAIAIAVMSLGYIERDGIIILGGVVGAVAGIVFNLSLTGGFLLLGFKFLQHLAS